MIYCVSDPVSLLDFFLFDWYLSLALKSNMLWRCGAEDGCIIRQGRNGGGAKGAISPSHIWSNRRRCRAAYLPTQVRKWPADHWQELHPKQNRKKVRSIFVWHFWHKYFRFLCFISLLVVRSVGTVQCIEVRLASFLSGGFTTMVSTWKETGKTHHSEWCGGRPKSYPF